MQAHTTTVMALSDGAGLPAFANARVECTCEATTVMQLHTRVFGEACRPDSEVLGLSVQAQYT